jgi:hypothetical protein
MRSLHTRLHIIPLLQYYCPIRSQTLVESCKSKSNRSSREFCIFFSSRTHRRPQSRIDCLSDRCAGPKAPGHPRLARSRNDATLGRPAAALSQRASHPSRQTLANGSTIIIPFRAHQLIFEHVALPIDVDSQELERAPSVSVVIIH